MPSRLAFEAAGALSIVIWVGILSAGRWIAYYEPPKPVAEINEGLTRTKTLITLDTAPRSRILSKGDKSK